MNKKQSISELYTQFKKSLEQRVNENKLLNEIIKSTYF